VQKIETILFDFDGTLLPCLPHDSEQALLDFLLRREKGRFRWFDRLLARTAIWVDQRELSPGFFKRKYGRFVLGTRSDTVDAICRRLADAVPGESREAVRELKQNGFEMHVISCGTADLAEGVLKHSGLRSCFDRVEGNRFHMVNGVVSGVAPQVKTPAQKVVVAKALGVDPDRTIAVGDGYTDLPLLDWAGKAVMLDPDGAKATGHAGKGYQFVAGIHELPDLIANMAGQG